MPGTPDPVLGSELLSLVVAAVVAAAALAVPAVAETLDASGPRPAVLAVGGGLAYAVACVGAWVGARLVADAFVGEMVADPATLVGWTLAGLAVLGVQAGVPYYLYARWRLVTPLVVLFPVTVAVLVAFLGVRGESDPLALYVLFFGPTAVLGSGVLALAEVGVRRLAVGGA